MISWTALGKLLAEGQGRGIPPLQSALVDHLGSWVQLCDHQHKRGMDVLDRVQCSIVLQNTLYS